MVSNYDVDPYETVQFVRNLKCHFMIIISIISISSHEGCIN